MHSMRRLLLRRACRRLLATQADGRDSGVLTDYHITPMGDSDLGYRTRIERLSKEMLESKQVGIRCLSRFGFRLIDGTFLYGPIAVFPMTVLSWRVLTPDDINEQSVEFFTMLEPKIDVLVMGVGDRKHVDPIRKRIAPILIKNRVGLEIMDTEEAISTFNFLNADHRCVAAALYPPDEMVITEAEHGRAMSLLRGYDELDENPLFAGWDTTYSPTQDLIRKLWDGRKSEVLQRILDPNTTPKKRILDPNTTPKKRIGDK